MKIAVGVGGSTSAILCCWRDGAGCRWPAGPPRNPYPYDLVFDPMYYGSGERDRVVEWEAALGLGLFPIGYVNKANPLWTARSGAIYYGIKFGLYSLGGSFAEAIDRLLIPDIGNVILE